MFEIPQPIRLFAILIVVVVFVIFVIILEKLNWKGGVL